MIKDLSPLEFKLLIEDKNVCLIDVREPWEFQICKIEGAINIPMSKIEKRCQELAKDHKLAIYCHHGVRSLKVISFLHAKEYQSLFNLRGGIDLWSTEIDKSIAKY